jgi:hypothetical protein
MIWPVQKTGLPYNIVRFPNGPLIVPQSLPFIFTDKQTETVKTGVDMPGKPL